MKSTTLFGILLVSALWNSTAVANEPTKVLIVVGPSDHPPGTHEVAAGGRLMEYCLEGMANVPEFEVELVQQWPSDISLLNGISSVVFIGDTFPLQRMNDTNSTMAALGSMMDRGCGIVCVHYATGLRAEDVAKDGEHPLLHWMGGYFATRCPHHQSVARIYPAAKITPDTSDHPICRGWKEFTIHDEPYINNFFGKDQNRMASNVTAIASSMLPPENPKREVVAWCVERKDSGRGMGIVMPHFVKSWMNEDLRRCILNGIVWTTKREVPPEGVQTRLPDLATFKPASIEPMPRPSKAK